MSKPEETRNLLIVSDMHVSEGSLRHDDGCCYGHDAFLYDGAFARFLRYHQQQRVEAWARLASRDPAQDRIRESVAAGRGADAGRHACDDTPDELLLRPWRLIIAGDFIDFWDISRMPGDHNDLRASLKAQLPEFHDSPLVRDWICRQLARLDAVVPSGEPLPECDAMDSAAGGQSEGAHDREKPPELDYGTVRAELDGLRLMHGPHRRTIEHLAWWTESLLLKEDLKLSTREQRHGLGTTWPEVVWKLTHVYRGHRELFAALAWFIAYGNEVVLLKGNHDIELYWPEVHCGQLPHLLADAYRDLLDGAPVGPTLDQQPLALPGNAPSLEEFKGWLPEFKPEVEADTGDSGKAFRFAQWIYYEEDHVYVEHGNQYEPADASASFLACEWPQEAEKQPKIELPWGGFIARYVYNKIVAVHPFAMNIKPETQIIHWMINNDLIRILGIVLAEVPDIVEALRRAMRQGLRSGWIWGDRSILGLFALGAKDYYQLRYRERAKTARRIEGEQKRLRLEMAGEQGHDTDEAPSRTTLWINMMLYALSFGLVVLVAIGGVAWLSGPSTPGWWPPALAACSALVVAAVLFALAATHPEGWHTLAEVLLQLGVVGLLVLATAALLLAPAPGWDSWQRWLTPLIPAACILVAALIHVLSRRFLKPVPEPKGLFQSWQAITISSSASLLRELGSVALLAGAYTWVRGTVGATTPGLDRPSEVRWLLAAVALLVLSWLGSQVHSWYTNRWRADLRRGQSIESARRTVRTVGNVLVALLALGVLIAVVVSLLSWFAGLLQLGPGATPFGEGFDRFQTVLDQIWQWFTEIHPTFGLSRLPVLLLGIGFVILVQLFLARVLRRLAAGQEDLAVPSQGTGEVTLSPSEQLRAIEALARAEQRRWTAGLGEILTLLLPVLSAGFLVVALGGLGTIVFGVTQDKTLQGLVISGASLSAIAGAAFWLLRQLSASVQRHDPGSGFGDLFPRMAANIASILRLGNNAGHANAIGQPRYFVFGHDHWADAKPLVPPASPSASGTAAVHQQWYVNSGTWLRGYVAEQREEEVSENHSTFVQIIPDLEREAAPRVLRWNDDANQPEWIVRREPPASVNDLLWSRWSERRWRVAVWMVLLAAAVIAGAATSTCWFREGLLPIAWALVLWWPVSSVVMWLLRRFA